MDPSILHAHWPTPVNIAEPYVLSHLEQPKAKQQGATGLIDGVCILNALGVPPVTS